MVVIDDELRGFAAAFALAVFRLQRNAEPVLLVVLVLSPGPAVAALSDSGLRAVDTSA
jgi:hypothetical protein